MNGDMQGIVDNILKFNSYLQSINLQEFREKYTKNELTEFKNALNTIRLRSLGFEVSELVADLKFMEYPELLGVHHFPIVKEADFLSENEQKELDEYLGSLRKGEGVTRLKRIVHNNTKKLFKLEQFLVENHIIEPFYLVICPSCNEGYLSKPLSESEKRQLEKALKGKPNTEERFNLLSEILLYACVKCEGDLDIDTIQSVDYKIHLKMIGEREQHIEDTYDTQLQELHHVSK